jgi:Carboxypeptidase regulatory-like domain
MRIFPALKQTNASPNQFNLAQIRIASPCPANWERMPGNDQVRHCSECNLNVYNLSAMTEREIKQLIAANQGRRLCGRFYRRADGTVITQDCPWSLRAMGRRTSRIVSAMLTAFMSFTPAAAKSKPPKPTCECRQTQQKDSGIKLTVMDPDGAVIPNAEINLENKSGKKAFSGFTGPAGKWDANLAPGEYALTVKWGGFGR